MKKTSRFSWFRQSAVALTLTGTMLLGMIPVSAAPNSADHTDTQISSAVETVYVDTYSGNQREINFNDHWRFNLGEANNAQDVTFNDSEWQNVNLPHDYSIEQKYTTAGEAESGYLPGGVGWYRKTFQIDPTWKTEKRLSVNFDGVYMNAEVYLNGHLLGSHPYGYTAFSFELPEQYLVAGQNVLAVKVDHKTPSSRWYSGSGIYRDVTLVVTDRVHVAPNGVTVTAETNGSVHVQTVVSNDSGAASDGLTVTTSVMKKGSDNAPTTADTPVTFNNTTATVETDLTVSNPELWNVWSKGAANLYVVKTEVKQGDKVLDTVETEFGFRSIEFKHDTGFYLNGNPVKLKGVCMHHDQGALGSEAWADAIRRQVKVLKEMGCNAIRVTHNPAAKVLIDICNEEGMLVIEEAFDTWSRHKNGNGHDYGSYFKQNIADNNSIEGGNSKMTWAEFDIKSMVSRDKNAPCVIMWSLGNEIFESTFGSNSLDEYPTIAENLIKWVGEVDHSRYVTIGDNQRATGESSTAGQVNARVANATKHGDVLGGVVGFNYGGGGEIPQGHQKGWLMYGSETASAVNSRGVYHHIGLTGLGGKTGDQQLSSYDTSKVSWGAVASDAWWRTINHDYDAGEFVWTGFDYIGEPTPWNNPGSGITTSKFENSPKSSYFGIVETTGFPKDSFYLYQSQWHDGAHTLHVLPTWNEQDLPSNHGTVEVVVYSDAPVIRLYLNDKEIGAAKAVAQNTSGVHQFQTYTACDLKDGGSNVFQSANGHQSLYATFNVPYEAGKLEAKAFKADGTPITDTKGRSKVETTGAAHHLNMTVDADKTSITADGKSLSYVTIDVVDEQGRPVNAADNQISLSISGNGTIVGVDNGKQSDHTSYQSTTWKAAHGKLLAIVQSTEQAGTITLTATAEGLTNPTASATVTTTQDPNASAEAKPVSLTYARNYYVQKGHQPKLPDTIQVNFSDGKTENAAVAWNLNGLNVNEEKTNVVSGTLTLQNGSKLMATVNVSMIGEVACLKNYSAAVLKGAASANLPNALPAVMSNGELSKVSFPVTWNEDTLKLNEAGLYTVIGSATVFGKELHPIATIRVSEGSVTPDGNVAAAAAKLNLNGQPNNSLKVIRDGKKAANSAAWSGQGNVQFVYDTAQNMIKTVVYVKNGTAAPEVFWAPDSSTWTKIDVQPTTGSENGLTTYTYEFGMVPAVGMQISFANAAQVVEIELHAGTPSFEVGSTTELSSLKAGDFEANAGILHKGVFNLSGELAADAVIEAVGKDNASVTVLPRTGNEIRILVESEDHTKTDYFTIRLNSTEGNGPVADDSGFDYDRTKTTATAPSWHDGTGNEGGPSNAVDGRPESYWHSRYNGGGGLTDLSHNPEQRYIQLELQEEARLNGLRYLPRPGAGNGTVTKYRVEVSTDGKTWTPVSEGSWACTNGWKLAEFDAPTNAKFVRLYGVNTAANGNNSDNKFMSAAEVRVCVDQGVKGDTGILGFRPVAVTTVIGTAPEMPKTVSAFKADATDADVNVTWDSTANLHIGKNTVHGTVAGTTLRPVAIVTVTEGAPQTDLAENKNGVDLPMAIAWVSSPGDNPSHATDGNVSWATSGGGKNVWTDWEKNTYHMDNNWMGVILGSGKDAQSTTVGQVRVGFFDEGSSGAHSVKLPTAYKIEYYAGPEFTIEEGNATTPDGQTAKKNSYVSKWANENPLKNDANWKEVTYVGEQPAIPGQMNNELTIIDFVPVKTTAIRISLTPQAQQWVGLTAFQVFEGYTAPLNTQPLTDAIAAAKDAKKDIQVTDQTADQVAKDTQFVSTAVDQALTDAIAAAEQALTEAKTQDALDAAVTALNNAVKTYTAAIQIGTYVEPAPLNKEALTTAIANANKAKEGIAVSEKAASEIAQGTKFVTPAVDKALTDAIAAANKTLVEAKTQDALDAAVTALDNAVKTYTAAIQTGTHVAPAPLEKGALTEAIAAANKAKEGIAVSEKDASEIAQGIKFVTPAVDKALTDAIAAANKTLAEAKTQDELDAAVTALNKAVKTYTDAIQTGTYVKPEPPVDPDIPPYIPPVRPTEPTKPTKPVVKPELPFTDVNKSDWFYDSVYSAWENNLLDGMTATEFAPNSTLTVAQTIKLAAALHEREKLGKVTLTNGAEQWYSTYVTYAIANDIIDKSYADRTPAQMNAPVSRREFVKILHGALDFYAAKNTVADNAIPDVKMADQNAAEIYEFYRAGILTGSDAKGTFLPETTIKRSEAAAILVRMFDVTERQTITLQ